MQSGSSKVIQMTQNQEDWNLSTYFHQELVLEDTAQWMQCT